MAQNDNNDRKLKHLFDGSDLNVYESSVLNLGVGAPGPDLLANCCDIFQQATAHRLKYERESNDSLLFQYGPAGGIFEARSAVANYLESMYGNEVRSEALTITTGATHGLHLILSTLVDLNGFIFVDEVTYFIALSCIGQLTTLHTIPVRLNDDGVDLLELEHAIKLKKFKSKSKLFWGIYYTIPTYHNPTGILFSPNVCESLIKLARKYDLLIVCDDVYNILNYDNTSAPKRLFAYDQRCDADYAGNVVSNGSFSKIIGPGIRLGWLELPERCKTIIDASGVSQSGGCFNNYTSGIIATLFELNLAQDHIRQLYNAYKERMLATCKVFKMHLSEECKMLAPKGGYFIWITLPENVDAEELLKFSMTEEKIWFLPGRRFSYANEAKNSLRISIAFHAKEKLIDGATRLCAVITKYLKYNK